ncbi:MAG: AAA family ATPase [Hyphomicrobiales bacterium]|nr:AAA family ATPase [Hyphomicrobiales bacterium]
MARRNKLTRLPAPFLRRLSLKPEVMAEQSDYPFDLPWLQAEDFELQFTTPVTIVIGENGTGKSTLIEAIAALSGYDEAGGGKGYRPVDHANAIDTSGAGLASALRGSWLPKITNGWFFKAESFFSVARYLDQAALEAKKSPPDFLSWSHGDRRQRLMRRFADPPAAFAAPARPQSAYHQGASRAATEVSPK